MAFTSFQFIMISLLFLLIYLFSTKTVRKCLLLFANILFCFSFQNSGVFYLLGLTVYSYWVGIEVSKKGKINRIKLSIMLVLLGLILSKYALFVLDLMNVTTNLQLIVPIGVSFYTFKILGYLIDLYKGKVKLISNFLDYFIYVSFFPQLASGPIQRSTPFMEDLSRIDHKIEYNELRTGFLLFIFGAFEKVVIANRLAFLVNQVYGDISLFSSGEICIAMLAYSFQLYSDFDAYSNMAIGLGRMLGFNTMQNFKTPYLAVNIQDFWRRWHISMSSWFKDYVYIPLGGNRTQHKYRNIFIVSLVSGLWHGGALNFVIWGLMHGIAQCIAAKFNNLVTRKIEIKNRAVRLIARIVSIIFTFSIVTVLWVFFRLSSVHEINQLFQALLKFNFTINFELLGITYEQFLVTSCLVIGLVGVDILRNYFEGIETFKKWPFVLRWFVYINLVVGFILFAMYGGGYSPKDFIYVQF